MSQKFYKFFTWIAGVDRDILSTCSTFEKIKHTGIGMLIIIPVLLGFVSMSFAISTLTNKWYVYLPIALMWGFIILIIDRFLISTFRKSESILKDVFSFKLLVRLVFSIGIGITVSHPLVLFVLDSTIQKNVSKSYEKEREVVLNIAKLEADSINNDIIKYRQNTIDKISAQIDCITSVRSAERSGEKKTIECNGKTYYTSGINTFGPRAQEYENDIQRLTNQQDSLYKEFNFFQRGKLAFLKEKNTQMTNELLALKANFSTDYLSRTIALSRLENNPVEGQPVKNTKWFLLAFFIFLDVLPIILKASLTIGEYDKKIKKNEEMNIYLANFDFDSEKEIESIKRESRNVYQRSKLYRMKHSDFVDVNAMNEFMATL